MKQEAVPAFPTAFPRLTINLYPAPILHETGTRPCVSALILRLEVPLINSRINNLKSVIVAFLFAIITLL